MDQSRNHVLTFAAELTAEQENFILRAISEVTGTVIQHHRAQPDAINLEQGDKLTEAAVPSNARAEGRFTVTGIVDQEEFMNSHDTHGRNWDYDHFDLTHNTLLSFGIPRAPEVKIIAVEGDSFLIQYSTEVSTDEEW